MVRRCQRQSAQNDRFINSRIAPRALELQAQDLHKLGTLISQGNALRDPHVLIVSELERNPDPDW